MQKIVPHLWFDTEAEEAARHYASLVPGSEIASVVRYPRAGEEVHGRPEGSVMTVEFTLGGARLLALNGGPHFRFTPAISLFVVLETEAAVDRLWAGLAEGGKALMPIDRYPWSERYGWVADRWGLTWQVSLGRREAGTVTPALLFGGAEAGQAERALRIYASSFPDASICTLVHHDGKGADPAGTLQHGQMRIGRDALIAMDSALPHAFGFSEAVSLMVLCEAQAEIDRLWSALSAVPEAERCGWLKDRFGVSWQIAPRALGAMMTDPDRDRVERVMASMMSMKKLDLAALERARDGLVEEPT